VRASGEEGARGREDLGGRESANGGTRRNRERGCGRNGGKRGVGIPGAAEVVDADRRFPSKSYVSESIGVISESPGADAERPMVVVVLGDGGNGICGSSWRGCPCKGRGQVFLFSKQKNCF